MSNLLNDLPSTLSEELVTVLAKNQYVHIERIVSTGHANPEGFWYDQERRKDAGFVPGESATCRVF